MEEGGSGVAHPVGTAWSLSDTCGQAECIQRQDTLYVTYQSCGYAEVCNVQYTSVVDPDPDGSALIFLGWIRIRIGNADLDPGGQQHKQ
jgi:hypothetical protein